MWRCLAPLVALGLQVSHALECGSGGSPTAAELQLNLLTAPDAICNDGTPSGYYWAPGTGDGVNTTLVFLAGGAWCYDKRSCSYRWNVNPDLMSSRRWPKTCLKSGIFDKNATVNPLARANKVYINYCSSDAFMGDRAASPATYGWAFRGQKIVEAVLKDIHDKRGLLKKPGEVLVFGGGSAGARGAMAWEERVRSLLPPTLPIFFFLDSPLWLDVVAYDPSAFIGFQIQTMKVLDLTNATRMIPPECSRAFLPSEQWKCLYGEYRMPFLQSPYLIVAAQYDSFQLSHDLETEPGVAAAPPFGGEMLVYADMFGERTKGVLAGLPVPPSQPTAHTTDVTATSKLDPQGQGVAQAVYSFACYNHHISDFSGFWSVTTSHNVSIASALRTYLDRPANYRWVDECLGFGCGSGCGALMHGRGPPGRRPRLRPHGGFP